MLTTGLRSKLIGFAGGLALALGLVGVMSPALLTPSAFATDPDHAGPECVENGDRGGINAGEPLIGASRASRSDIMTPQNSPFCQRISSIYTVSTIGQGAFEVGELEGYSNCPGYTHIWYAHPVPFFWATMNDGVTYMCRVYASVSLTPGGTDTFTGSDINQDGLWLEYVNGTNVCSCWILDFMHGNPQLSTERGHGNDVCTAKFTNLSDDYPSQGGWDLFDDLVLNQDGDPDCHFNRINAHAGEMLAP